MLNYNSFLLLETWYHGTYDSREIDEKGFKNDLLTIEYVDNLEEYNKLQDKIKKVELEVI